MEQVKDRNDKGRGLRGGEGGGWGGGRLKSDWILGTPSTAPAQPPGTERGLKRTDFWLRRMARIFTWVWRGRLDGKAERCDDLEAPRWESGWLTLQWEEVNTRG